MVLIYQAVSTPCVVRRLNSACQCNPYEMDIRNSCTTEVTTPFLTSSLPAMPSVRRKCYSNQKFGGEMREMEITLHHQCICDA